MIAFNDEYRDFSSLLLNMEPEQIRINSTDGSLYIVRQTPNLNIFHKVFDIGMTEFYFGKMTDNLAKSLSDKNYFNYRIQGLMESLKEYSSNRVPGIMYDRFYSFKSFFVASIKYDVDMLDSILLNSALFQPNSDMLIGALAEKRRNKTYDIGKISAFLNRRGLGGEPYSNAEIEEHNELAKRLMDSTTAEFILSRGRVIVGNVNTSIRGGWVYREFLRNAELYDARVTLALRNCEEFNSIRATLNKIFPVQYLMYSITNDNNINTKDLKAKTLDLLKNPEEFLKEREDNLGKLITAIEKDLRIKGTNNSPIRPIVDNWNRYFKSFISGTYNTGFTDADNAVVFQSLGLDLNFMINLRQFIPSDKTIRSFVELADFYSKDTGTNFKAEILFATRSSLARFPGSGIALVELLTNTSTTMSNGDCVQFYSEVFSVEKEELVALFTEYKTKKLAILDTTNNYDNTVEIFTQFKKVVDTVKHPILRLDCELKEAFLEQKETGKRTAIAKELIEFEEMATYFGGRPDFTPVVAGVFVSNKKLERTFQYEFLKSKIQNFIDLNPTDNTGLIINTTFIYRSVKEFDTDLEDDLEKQELIQKFGTLKSNREKIKTLNIILADKKEKFVKIVKQKFGIQDFNFNEEDK